MGDSNMRLFADQLICSILQLLLCYDSYVIVIMFFCLHMLSATNILCLHSFSLAVTWST